MMRDQPFLEVERADAPEIDAVTTVGDDGRYKVIAHDDPITTMEFVVWAMVRIFQKPLVFAEAIMWQVHTEGQSVVDVLPKAEAERRVNQTIVAARMEGYPFQLTIEQDFS